VGRGRGRRERKVERRERRLKERGGRNGGIAIGNNNNGVKSSNFYGD
jgi:hypothetical protein